MNDPMWDLAYFAIESRLDDRAEQRLLAAYFGRAPRPAEAARVAVMKPICEAVTGLWALIQIAKGNKAGDFHAYAERVFASADARIGAAEWEEQIALVRAG